MPQSLIEAMACSNVAIASDIDACREIVKNGKNGFLFRQGDEEDLAERLEMVILNYQKLGGIAKSAREYAQEFSWNKIADRLEKLYKTGKFG
jgi:glycosyltransferase involved in cell wall biosynthesis